jgi:hypothetical protein
MSEVAFGVVVVHFVWLVLLTGVLLSKPAQTVKIEIGAPSSADPKGVVWFRDGTRTAAVNADWFKTTEVKCDKCGK